MQLNFFCPLWGNNHLPFEAFLDHVKSAGYHGVEMSFPLNENERSSMALAIKDRGLKLIAQHWETNDADFKLHKASYERHLRNVAATEPLFINAQTGKDYYSFAQNLELIALANEIALATGIPVIHEIHRGRFAFAAHVAQPYFAQLPDLKICLDISHWCCVAESLLADQSTAVETAIQKTHHIHARVGFAEGPQVMDPRAEEHQPIVEQHIAWWQKVVDNCCVSDYDVLTITPEFGAPPYQHLFPYTQQPIYSQWDVNIYMKELLKHRLKIN